MLLRVRYALPGTDRGYAGRYCRRAVWYWRALCGYALPGTDVAYDATSTDTGGDTGADMGGPPGTTRTSMVLCSRYALSGTDVAYAATRPQTVPGPRCWRRYGGGGCRGSVPGTTACYGPRYPVVLTAMALCACYAESGTDVAYGGTRRMTSKWKPSYG
eukprot:135159-Rhodomonas_salina.2